MTFKELATKRFSVRKYTDEPVSKADIEYIMDCVRLDHRRITSSHGSSW